MYTTQIIGEQTDDAKSAATGTEADSALGPVDLTRISEIETHDSEKIGKVPSSTLCLRIMPHMKIGLLDWLIRLKKVDKKVLGIQFDQTLSNDSLPIIICISGPGGLTLQVKAIATDPLQEQQYYYLMFRSDH